MKVEVLSENKSLSLKKFSKSVKAETQTQIKKRTGAYKVTNNMVYHNNRGPELPVRYAQTIATQQVISDASGTIVSLPFDTTGRPVRILCCGDMDPSGIVAWCGIQLYRDDVPLGNSFQLEISNIGETESFCIQVIDHPSVGTYNYSLRYNYKKPGTIKFGRWGGPVLTVIELRNQ
jgi:hypothetical protein